MNINANNYPSIMTRNLFAGLIIITLGCNSGNQTDKARSTTSNTGIPSDVKVSNDTTLLIDYRALLASVDQMELDFTKDLIATVTSFSSKKLDTTILSIGKIDIDNTQDTIKSRVFKDQDDIIVLSTWYKDSKILWTDTLVNPYLWISNNPLFDYEQRSFWVTFTIGVLYSTPEIKNIQKYSSLIDMASQIGVQSLADSGFKEDPDSYKGYLFGFKNDLVSWGDPENRDGLFIWYEPKQKFVLFYQD